jgi:glycosidase
LMREYPNFNIVGEQWTLNPAYIAPWQRSASGPEGSCLPSLFDFPLQRALVDALVEEESWWGGWFKLYEALAQDFQYEDPASLVTFPDNHDMDRFYRQIGEDLNLYKLGMAYLATVRGIPQIYYGTELLFVNSEKDDHGTIRIDFPGGWAGDTINGFTREGLSTDQLDAQAFTRTLLQWRKTASAVHQGKLEHYGPVDGVYVYFRYDQDQRVMVILNKNTGPHSLDMTRFAESMGNSKSGTDVLSGVEYNLNRPLELPPRAPLILELK